VLVGVAFWWASKSGQFDDLEGPAYRVVMDDDTPHPTAADQTSTQEVPQGNNEEPAVTAADPTRHRRWSSIS
jgi:nitrogen fixation-related uncharacterized protein